jgi:hypothetical protein
MNSHRLPGSSWFLSVWVLAVAGAGLSLPLPAQGGGLEIRDRSGGALFGYKESHALVIWAAAYRDPFWKKLNNISLEADQVVAALKAQGFQVTVVANPDSQQLTGSIDRFIQNHGFQPDNRLLIYYAGHGWTRKTNYGYLVPIDAPDASTVEGDLKFARMALSMEQILSWSKQIEAKHVLFVFDSCFSGSVFKVRGASRPPLYLERKMNLPVREFITAGDANEEVPAKSIFTPLFVRGLNGEADLNRDGYITGSELGDYLPQQLARYTQEQNPQYGKIRDPDLDQGDIVFRPPSLDGGSSAGAPLPSRLPDQLTPAVPTPPLAKPIPSPVPALSSSSPPALPAAPTPQPALAKAAADRPLLSATGESIVGPSAAVALVRARLPQGAQEQRNQCTTVSLAGNDRYRCTVWYQLP